ncbi:tRNA lysidine(34) synthetase TilS [Paracoccaceae bacterium GXU_MW_L88]
MLARAALEPRPEGPLGVAVSGGGDSMALLDLLLSENIAVEVATVDHGLRPESAAEAAMVARFCAARGVPHETLYWTWDGQGNLAAAARDGRRAALAAWAKARGIKAIALGHTAEDQAETLLMNLARGSGVDGLAAMPPRLKRDGLLWLRPLLGARRAELRTYLQSKNITWADDPGNDDPGQRRIQTRQAIAALDLDVPRLARTAARMAGARESLIWAEAELAARTLTQHPFGTITLDRQGLNAAPRDLRQRLVARVLRHISGAAYRPRLEDLGRVLSGETRQTLGGVVITHRPETLAFDREFAHVPDPVPAETGAIWDGRWQYLGPTRPGQHLAALGESGLKALPDWRESGASRIALLSAPGLWDTITLVAGPMPAAEAEEGIFRVISPEIHP